MEGLCGVKQALLEIAAGTGGMAPGRPIDIDSEALQNVRGPCLVHIYRDSPVQQRPRCLVHRLVDSCDPRQLPARKTREDMTKDVGVQDLGNEMECVIGSSSCFRRPDVGPSSLHVSVFDRTCFRWDDIWHGIDLVITINLQL